MERPRPAEPAAVPGILLSMSTGSCTWMVTCWDCGGCWRPRQVRATLGGGEQFSGCCWKTAPRDGKPGNWEGDAAPGERGNPA